MVQWWRLTRNPCGRAVYEALSGAGVHVATMEEWVREGPVEPRDPPPGVGIEVHAESFPSAVGRLDGPHDVLADAVAGDRLLVADDDGPVGYALVSDRTVYVEPLRRRVRYEAGYVWRVYVAPSHRERGIATALVARAATVAREAFDRDRQVALVAPDNRPSQWVLGAVGFEPRRRHTLVDLPGIERRWIRE